MHITESESEFCWNMDYNSDDMNFFQYIQEDVNINVKEQGTVLDQFYTRDFVVDMCLKILYEIVDMENRRVFIEPAAGRGAFLNKIENIVGMDIDPKQDNIIKKDFLTSRKRDFRINTIKSSQVCVVGNPPFGKNAHLAVKFFNHSVKFADTICFILPKTFRKKSIHKKLHKRFYLIKDIDLPKNSFTYNDKSYDVPCCFQIWKRMSTNRHIKFVHSCRFFKFVKKGECDFAVRRVGGRSGKAFLETSNCSETSNYFLKMNTDEVTKEEVVDIINGIDYGIEVNSTAGVRSLSKDEFLSKVIGEIKDVIQSKSR